jgi:hypothetical protein
VIIYSALTRKGIKLVTRDYLANGGKITNVEPEGIEEGKGCMIN